MTDDHKEHRAYLERVKAAALRLRAADEKAKADREARARGKSGTSGTNQKEAWMTYAIVEAQGHYGTYTKVERVFATLPEADAYAIAGRCTVIEGEFAVGERIHRIDAARYESRAQATRMTPSETALATIRARAYNDAARAMERYGVRLTHAQADDLGADALDWLRSRLGLRVYETDSHVIAEVV